MTATEPAPALPDRGEPAPAAPEPEARIDRTPRPDLETAARERAQRIAARTGAPVFVHYPEALSLEARERGIPADEIGGQLEGAYQQLEHYHAFLEAHNINEHRPDDAAGLSYCRRVPVALARVASRVGTLQDCIGSRTTCSRVIPSALRHPASAIASANSRDSISTTDTTPSSPAAASPQR